MKISEINIYPVKSLSGIALQKSIVEERGLTDDRRFMLVNEKNALITQREFPKLATIEVKLVEDELRVSSKHGGEIVVSKFFESDEKITVRVWRSFCEAFVADREVNDWFSETIGTNCRLVRMPDSTRRRINENFNKGDEIVSFADGYPVLVIGENSLADLNSKLEKQIPMNRFRPNIVVSGSAPFAEDSWKKIRIGKTIFRATKPSARCVVTTIDQETGVSDVKEPLKTLAEYRKASDVFPKTFDNFGFGKNDVLFGQNMTAENFSEEIRVGDKLEVAD